MKDIVTTVCHKFRHAYQFACIEAYENTDEEFKALSMFDNAEKFLINENNYIVYDGSNYDEYASQIMESDAFSYAYSVTQEYYSDLIPKYAEKQ